jgi:hypothetical protein
MRFGAMYRGILGSGLEALAGTLERGEFMCFWVKDIC